MSAASHVAEQFADRKTYPHISEVMQALESLGVTGDIKQLAAICSAPALFYSCLAVELTKHNTTVVREYLEYKYRLHHFHPCLWHIRRCLAHYSGSEFACEKFVAEFIAVFESFYQKFNVLCLEETGYPYIHEQKS